MLSGPDVQVTVSGEAVTRHGGRRVGLSDARGSHFEAVCNGACDDITFRASAGENAYRVRVLDSQGKCLICSPAQYVTAGISARWRIDGRDRLVLTTERPATR